MEIKGRGGQIRVGGRVAASFGEWTFDGKTTDWVIGAEVEAHNPVWLSSDGPFEVRLHLTKGYWRWRDVPADKIALLDGGRGGIRIAGTEKWTLCGLE
jgi:hypothetical protein